MSRVVLWSQNLRALPATAVEGLGPAKELWRQACNQQTVAQRNETDLSWNFGCFLVDKKVQNQTSTSKRQAACCRCVPAKSRNHTLRLSRKCTSGGGDQINSMSGPSPCRQMTTWIHVSVENKIQPLNELHSCMTGLHTDLV